MRIGRWTVKDVVQGKPWAHPTHPMFVHFPSALYPVALLFDALWLVTGDETWTRSATILVGIGIAAAVPAVGTGLVDWAGTVKGSTKRAAVTRHLWWQSAAQLAALGGLAVRVARPAAVGGVLVLALATGLLVIGNWLGGKLVYRMAMRVGGKPEPSPPRAKERA